jgi:hypothetical protein
MRLLVVCRFFSKLLFVIFVVIVIIVSYIIASYIVVEMCPFC